MFGIMVVVITARFGTSSEVYQPGEVSEADEFFEFQREVSSMNCLCRGLSAGRAVSGLDLAALDAELTALAKVDSAVAARRSLVAAEVKRRRSDPAKGWKSCPKPVRRSRLARSARARPSNSRHA